MGQIKMTDEFKKIIEALRAKEENERFVKNLEKLKAEGAVDQDLYPSMKTEYEQRLNKSISEIERIKNDFRKQLETIQQEQDSSKYELKKLEARHKAGELQNTEYAKSSHAVRNKIDALERQAEDLRGLIIAESATELEIPAEKPPVVPQAPASKPEKPKIEKLKFPKLKFEKLKLPGQKRLLFIGGAIILLIVIVLAIVLSLPKEPAVTDVQIPVTITGANNIGSLHVELVYDATVLEITKIENGTLMGNSLSQHNIDTPGRIIVGLINSKGIGGDGPLILINFQLAQKSSETISLRLENVAAYDASTLNRLTLSTMNGSFTTKNKSFTSPTIIFAPASK